MSPEASNGAAERGPSRSAQLVAACRALASELPEPDRLIEDPFAIRFVDEAALAEARANLPLQRVIRLRTRYVDDAIADFARTRPGCPVVLLGAGLDARPFRMKVDARFFEIDLPHTLAYRQRALAEAGVSSADRVAVDVDLGRDSFAPVLCAAGFDEQAPAIVVWEGVINYLDDASASTVVRELGALLAPESRVVADYVEPRRYDAAYRARTKSVAKRLSSGGEPLRSGLTDFDATFGAAGFDPVDDEAIEELAARYGLPSQPRVYPSRIATLERRRDER